MPKYYARAAARDNASGRKEALEVARREFLTRRYPLTDDRLLPRKYRGERPEVTVCIAARAGNIVVGASDRMLTAGDVQFEPSAGTKIFALSQSVFMMTAGDSALQAEITSMLAQEVTDRIQRDPHNWWRIGEVADRYVDHYNFVRNKRADSEILAPLGLTRQSYLSSQKSLSDRLVNDLAKELLNFEVPDVAAIFGGLDPSGAHIYTVHNNEANCVDNVGFAAIGIGRRHASSQFMFARHAWNSPFPDTLLLTYYAKRKAEVAPGVGIGTEMVIVGPDVNSLTRVGEHIIARLETEYAAIRRSEIGAFSRARNKVRSWIDDLTRQAEAAARAASGEQQTPPKSNGEPSPPNGPKV